MNKQKLYEILPKTDLKHLYEIKKRIAEIDEVKTLLIYGANGEMEDQDERVLKPLRNLSLLQMNLDSLMKDIEAYENKTSNNKPK